MTLYIHTAQLTKKTFTKALAPEYSLSHHGGEDDVATLLDTFDRELYKKGFLLLQSDKELVLLNYRTGERYQQKGHLIHKCIPQLAKGPVSTALTVISSIRALLPVAKIDYQEEVFALLDDEEKTVARLCALTIKAEQRQLQLLICKSIRGYTKAYTKLTEALITLGCDTSTESDLLTQLGSKGNSYQSKPEIPLQATAPIKDSTATIISTFIGVARQNEPGIADDYDTEFLHDYRVSLRKVRSVISLFKSVYSPETTIFLKEEFAEIMQNTGRLRDLDVYLLDKENYFALVPASTHEGLHILFGCFEKERDAQHHEVCLSLASKAYKKRIKKLQKGFIKQNLEVGSKAESASLPFACKLILKRYKKVCCIARSIDRLTPDEIVHELRIQCKKLRYLMEFFTPLFPKKQIKGLIKELKVLQDNLGRFNDYSVQQESLAAFLQDNTIEGPSRVKVAEAIGALNAMLNLRQQKERSLVMDNFSRFDSETTRQLFAQTFSL